jgi:hypothetical protein
MAGNIFEHLRSSIANTAFNIAANHPDGLPSRLGLLSD